MLATMQPPGLSSFFNFATTAHGSAVCSSTSAQMMQSTEFSGKGSAAGSMLPMTTWSSQCFASSPADADNSTP